MRTQQRDTTLWAARPKCFRLLYIPQTIPSSRALEGAAFFGMVCATVRLKRSLRGGKFANNRLCTGFFIADGRLHARTGTTQSHSPATLESSKEAPPAPHPTSTTSSSVAGRPPARALRATCAHLSIGVARCTQADRSGVYSRSARP